MSSDNEKLTKPVLRWAGGKSWFLKHLNDVKKRLFNNYHEPFLGGAAVFFFLKPRGTAFLSDLNKDLIETYQTIKQNAPRIIQQLALFENTEESYYQIRSTVYNSEVERAARFIYLNQTSFNGIYRVNLKGVYNVPFGFRTKDFIDSNGLLQAQKALANANLSTNDFYECLKNVRRGDLVFLDPPYTVSHNDNGFVKYNEKIFSLDDQIRLSGLIDEIKKRDAYYILTNAAHATIKTIFEKGDNQYSLNRASLIGGVNAQRGQTTEYVFTNITL